jgi:hypothetical protein
MAGMNVTKQLWQVVVLAAVVGGTAFAHAQDAPDTQAPAGQANAAGSAPTTGDDSELAAEVQRLRNDVDRLKRQVAYLNSVVEEMESERAPIERAAGKPAAKTSGTKKGVTAAAAAPSIAPDVDDRVTKTVLVFRDGHKTEAVNYAIVGQNLWIYTETDSKKVPLADLDMAATKSANSDRGVTFQVPPSK